MGKLIVALVVGSCVWVAAAAARPPLDTVLGLRLGMPKEAAMERLEKIGKSTPGEDEESATQQHWTLSDPTYAHAVINYDPRERIEWISVFARPGGRVVRFRDIGDLERASKRGNYIYTWSIPRQGKRGAYQVIARSRDPDTLQSLSLMSMPRKTK